MGGTVASDRKRREGVGGQLGLLEHQGHPAHDATPFIIVTPRRISAAHIYAHQRPQRALPDTHLAVRHEPAPAAWLPPRGSALIVQRRPSRPSGTHAR